MPNILVGALKRTEANTDTEQPLATPRITGRDGDLSDVLCFAGIHCHLNLLVHVGLEELLQCVIVLVQPCRANGYDKIKESLETSTGPGGIVLDLYQRHLL